MIEIDGSSGEGGGQILRTSLALSMVTRTAFRICRIRARRERPGLMRQHLAAVQAAAEISAATVHGAAAGSTELTFEPGAIRGGTYAFSIGTAGSTTLVLQAVLPALLAAAEPSTVTLEGGTHNPHAPPFDFLARAFLPLLERMGAEVALELERPGFHPAGGGRIVARIQPCAQLRGLEILERGRIRKRRARAIVANLPRHIAQRELDTVARKLGWSKRELAIEEIPDAPGPGNVLMLEVEAEQATELFTGFGELGIPAETVATRACNECRRVLKSDVPIAEHLADQIMLPMAIARSGAFRTLPLSSHAVTHAELIRRFLAVEVSVEDAGGDARLVRIGAS